MELFRECIGVNPVVINGEVASGLRFYKEDCDIAGNVDKWDEYIGCKMDIIDKIRDVISETMLQRRRSASRLLLNNLVCL